MKNEFVFDALAAVPIIINKVFFPNINKYLVIAIESCFLFKFHLLTKIVK